MWAISLFFNRWNQNKVMHGSFNKYIRKAFIIQLNHTTTNFMAFILHTLPISWRSFCIHYQLHGVHSTYTTNLCRSFCIHCQLHDFYSAYTTNFMASILHTLPTSWHSFCIQCQLLGVHSAYSPNFMALFCVQCQLHGVHSAYTTNFMAFILRIVPTSWHSFCV